jgi:predicted nucleic acid-binding protein
MSDKLKVYVESSFVCYLTGDQTANAKISADQAYTRQWWEEEKSDCDVHVSKYVIGECAVGRADAVAKRDSILKLLSVIDADSAKVGELAQKLIDGHALPSGETTDALHIASAAISGMDVLLTWNCRHMANPHTLPKTIKIIENAGYRCPWIMTPKTFLDNKNMEVSNA